jgi:two-component system sensor histidine kinase KdpD
MTGWLAPVVGEDEITAVTMVFLIVVLLASALWGYLVGLTSAILADLLLNFFFVPPLHTFTVQEPRNVVALVVFLAVAAIGASMLALLRRQLAAADARRAELAVMLDLSRELASASSARLALDTLAHSITRALGARRCDVLQRSGSDWQTVGSSGVPVALTRDEVALANQAVESGQVARQLEPQFGGVRLQLGGRRIARHTFVPFRSGAGIPGALRITGQLSAPGGGDLDALLRGMADEAGTAVHRAWLTEQNKRTEAIQRSDEFKSVLLSSVSHDLRSPLTAIKAAIGSLRSDGLEWSEEDRRQLMATIESQTDRLTDTVTDLLDMSRLESGSVQVNLEPVNVRALLDDTALATSQATEGRRVCVDSASDIWTSADYGLMLRVMTNLIENAAKYSTPGGAISLGAESTGGRVVISVADEGPGIPREDLPFIFEKFYRGTTGRKTLGSGLGLSIVKAMVDLNRGRITVDSTESGTTFHLSLPPASAPR